MCYDTMHLTENIRTYDKSEDAEGVQREVYATNAEHAVSRILFRMMMAIPVLVPTRGEYLQPLVFRC